MIWTLIEKQMQAIIRSPKFVGIFLVCVGIILLSVYVGIQEYHAAIEQQATVKQLVDEQMTSASSWGSMSTKALRQPDPVQIFASGLHFDVGRFSRIDEEDAIKLEHSVYTDDPIYAIFRFIDFAFIIQVVISLFAIVLTYDAVSGEREKGTLRLIFSHAVSRAQYLIATCTGAWLVLVGSVVVPVILGLLMVMFGGISFSGDHWVRLLILFGGSLLYITFFVVLGICVSALTRRSSVSFLAALIIWIATVLIFPRVGALVAEQMLSVPTVAQIEGEADAFSKTQWNNHYVGMSERFESYVPNLDDVTDEELWASQEFEDSVRNDVELRIDAHQQKLLSTLNQRRAEQERLALSISRISPAAAYQLMTMKLAGTGLSLKTRYEEAMNIFRDDFLAHKKEKAKTEGESNRIAITMDSELGFSVQAPEKGADIDLSGVPQFVAPRWPIGQAIQGAVVDFGILAILGIVSFCGAFVAFVRYDVR